jgi:hypothetical protein
MKGTWVRAEEYFNVQFRMAAVLYSASVDQCERTIKLQYL